MYLVIDMIEVFPSSLMIHKFIDEAVEVVRVYIEKLATLI